MTREPNWVHQEPVSDGSRVAIGFGDNLGSLDGYAPSGVAVHDLRTGVRLWMRFTVGSVMNSPVIAHDLVVVTTSARELLAFDATDGDLKWSVTLPGESVMGPAALRGDSIFVGLEPNLVCSFSLTGSKYWCVRVPNAGGFGLSALSIVGNEIVLTSTTDKNWLQTVGTWTRVGIGGLLQWLSGNTMPPVVRQDLVVLRASDGALLGRVALGEGPPPDGHSSGTAVPLENRRFIAVVAASTKRLVVVDLVERRVVWGVDLGAAARGPPTILTGDTALVINRIGVAHVIDLRGHREVCSSHLQERFDRVGAAVSGGFAIAGTESGRVLAIPTAELLSCIQPRWH
jgi:hypothetical protein